MSDKTLSEKTSPAKDHKAAYIAALEAEKAGYLRVGKKERAAEVDAEIKRAKGRKPKVEDPEGKTVSE